MDSAIVAWFKLRTYGGDLNPYSTYSARREWTHGYYGNEHLLAGEAGPAYECGRACRAYIDTKPSDDEIAVAYAKVMDGRDHSIPDSEWTIVLKAAIALRKHKNSAIRARYADIDK